MHAAGWRGSDGHADGREHPVADTYHQAGPNDGHLLTAYGHYLKKSAVLVKWKTVPDQP